VNLYES